MRGFCNPIGHSKPRKSRFIRYPMHISGSISDIDKQFVGLWYTKQSAILQKLNSANLKFTGYAYTYKQIVPITWIQYCENFVISLVKQ